MRASFGGVGAHPVGTDERAERLGKGHPVNASDYVTVKVSVTLYDATWSLSAGL